MRTGGFISVARITAAFFSAGAFASPYMGGPVELVKTPNGAITNKKLLDRVGDFSWLKPTIENTAAAVLALGGWCGGTVRRPGGGRPRQCLRY